MSEFFFDDERRRQGISGAFDVTQIHKYYYYTTLKQVLQYLLYVENTEKS